MGGKPLAEMLTHLDGQTKKNVPPAPGLAGLYP